MAKSESQELETGSYYYARRLSDGVVDIVWCHGSRERPRLSALRSQRTIKFEDYEILGPVPEWVERRATA